jgi:hypothetical protein
MLTCVEVNVLIVGRGGHAQAEALDLIHSWSHDDQD